jgi:hypothetical protein
MTASKYRCATSASSGFACSAVRRTTEGSRRRSGRPVDIASTCESAGRSKGNGATGHGNRYLARVLGEAAAGAACTNSFLGERYRRIARRRGKKRAIVAVARSTLVIIWHLLRDDQATFTDLGPDHYDTRGGTQRAIRNHIRALNTLGYQVDLRPAA